MAIKITPKQSRKINALIRRCCANCFDGNCLLLDDGETCPCIQLISRSRLYCNYFKNAILPTDEALYAETMKPQEKKRCVVCGTAFVPKSNRQKYCPDCRAAEERKKDRLRKQKNGIAVSAFRHQKEPSYQGFFHPVFRHPMECYLNP